MADKGGFERVADWLLKDKEIKVAVLSAGGKTKGNAKVTDLLVDAWDKINSGEGIDKSFQPFFNRVKFDATQLGLLNFINEELMKIEQEVEKDFSLDFVLSRGEFIYAKLFSAFCGVPFLDSKNLIGFYEDGKLNLGFSEYQIKRAYEKYGRFITGGFYGAFPNGKIKTFSRGGSDFSGAIIAKGLNACEYLNFTDVDGVYSIDPKLAKGEVVKEISFDFIRLLGEFGAGVLHPASVLPLYGSDTVIRLKNTFNPLAEGTLIKEDCSSVPFAVALKRDCCLVRGYAREGGYKIIESLSKLNLKIAHSTASADYAEACVFDMPILQNMLGLNLKTINIESGFTFFYLTPTDKTNDVVNALKKDKILRFVSSFKNGVYLAVKSEDEKEVLKALVK